MKDFRRKEGEHEFHFIWRVYSYMKQTGEITTEQAGEICNTELRLDFDESRHRKIYESWEKVHKQVIEEYTTADENEIIQEIESQKDELYKERTRLRDEKNEKRAWLREDARAELMFERIDESIDRFLSYKPRIIPEKIERVFGDKTGFCGFADCHYGADFKLEGLMGDVIAEYSPEIFKTRMWDLRDRIKEFSKLHKINHFCIVDAGDAVEGILHLSQIKSLRGNVVDDIMDYSDFIDDWLMNLSEDITIDFYTSEGNHSDLRLLTGKKGDFPHENLEKIYSRCIRKAMRNNPNVNVHVNVRGLNYFDIQGYKFLTAHGQAEKNVLNSIHEYEQVYNIHVDYFVSGHMHNKKEMDANGERESIQLRSVMGANDFSVGIKKVSPPGATIFSVERNYGKRYAENVKFK